MAKTPDGRFFKKPRRWQHWNYGQKGTKYGPQKHNIPSIIRGFKGKVTFRAKKINQKFAWQPRYYDHVIRNYTEYVKIRIYILENPLHPC